MPDLFREITTWALDYVQHIVVMMYWVWIPGFLVAALVSVRYRPLLQQIVLQRRRGAAAVWAAVGWGMTSGAGRRSSLDTAQRLWQEGLPDAIVLAYLVASQSLTLYGLVLFTILIGLEFGLGLWLGGLVMIGLLRLTLFVLPRAPSAHPRPAQAPVEAPDTWKTLLASGHGWRRVLGDIGGYGRNMSLSLVGGLILGMIETMSVAYLVPAWKDGFAFGILILVLLLKPSGLFGSRLQIEAGR